MTPVAKVLLTLNPDGEPIFDETVADLGGVWLFPGLPGAIPVSPAPQDVPVSEVTS
jgi:hypothetical protein